MLLCRQRIQNAFKEEFLKSGKGGGEQNEKKRKKKEGVIGRKKSITK